MWEMRLYTLQRLTAALMVPLILVHLFVIFYATSSELTAAAILGRTQGSLIWAALYGLFVVLAAVHGAIGVRGVLREWTRFSAGLADAVMFGVGMLMLALGLRAVIAVVVP